MATASPSIFQFSADAIDTPLDELIKKSKAVQKKNEKAKAKLKGKDRKSVKKEQSILSKAKTGKGMLVTKSKAAGKAKRDQIVANRRGLAKTKKADGKAVNKAVSKAVGKKAKQVLLKAKSVAKKKTKGVAAAKGAGKGAAKGTGKGAGKGAGKTTDKSAGKEGGIGKAPKSTGQKKKNTPSKPTQSKKPAPKQKKNVQQQQQQQKPQKKKSQKPFTLPKGMKLKITMKATPQKPAQRTRVRGTAGIANGNTARRGPLKNTNVGNRQQLLQKRHSNRLALQKQQKEQRVNTRRGIVPQQQPKQRKQPSRRVVIAARQARPKVRLI